MKEWDGQKRATVENVEPQGEGGKYVVKHINHKPLVISADIFVDGHDRVDGNLLYRKLPSGNSKKAKPRKWKEIPMEFMGNDRWQATLLLSEEGIYEYTIKAWVDYYGTWAEALKKKHAAEQDIATELKIGIELLENAQLLAKSADKKKLTKWIALFDDTQRSDEAVEESHSKSLNAIMRQWQSEQHSLINPNYYKVKIERERAGFSAWYELFPRSTAMNPGTHGTFKDVERLMPRIAEMGFDVLYLPPIHPIGTSHRKGKNNATTAREGEPGSPWAIGNTEGGHKAMHPQLGSLDDFQQLIQAAEKQGMEIALDFALQCSPDHPYVKENPQWFKWRPDGTVQYAENPPKKYQDVLPFDFETKDWENLWKELKSIVDYWINQGVRIFRVDNPHTKPFRFWEWLITTVHQKDPGIIFLAEAFTRPRIMEKLAKIGFTQSYTYFTWRNTAAEIKEYMEELTKTEMRYYFRPNFWPNTPDILPVSLENQPESAFISRAIMASTLSSNYGVYGPVFELGLNEAVHDKEEYIDNEKYEIKNWDWDYKTLTRETLTLLNKIRKANSALHTTHNIEFADCENPELLCFAKVDHTGKNRIAVIINMDPFNVQSGWVQLPLQYIGIKEGEDYEVHDLLSGNHYTWHSGHNYVELNPQTMPAHIFLIKETPLASQNEE